MPVVAFSVCAYARAARSATAEVERHRLGVGVNLNDRNLASLVVDVLVEGKQPWFLRLDEIDQTWDSPPLVVELSRLEPVGRDEDERAVHPGTSVKVASAA